MSQPTESKSAPTVDFSTEIDAATLVDSYADSLMDNLFANVDQLLEGDDDAVEAVLHPHPEPEPEPMTMVTPLMPLAGAIDLPQLSVPASAVPEPKPSWFQRHLPRLVSGGLVAVTAGITGLWFFYSRQQPVAEVPVATTESPAQIDNSEFLQYLQRSLDTIDAQAEATAAGSQPGDLPQVAVLPGGAAAPSGSVPGEPVLGSPSPGRSGPLNVIERVYVPYQPVQPIAPAPVVQAPQPQAAPATPGTAANPSSTTARAAATNTLMGVLELGDRSAALFEIDGVPQRVSIGGRIGESGWNLVSVSNDQAVIRRNGEVRSIFIGQQF